MLRTAGDRLSGAILADHDEALDMFVGRTLGGDLPRHSLDQAAMGVAQGGLGFRRAAGLALSAFVASRIEARPFVEHLFASMAIAGVVVPEAMALYDNETAAAWHQVRDGLSEARAQLAGSFVEAASESSQTAF